MMMTVKRAAVSLVMGCVIGLGTCGATRAVEVALPTWWWGESAPIALLKKATAEFEKDNPGDTIKPIKLPYEGFLDRQYSEVRAGSPADFVTLFSLDMAAYLKADLLEPLDKYVAAAGVSLDQLNSSRKYAMKDGHIYGITLGFNPRALMINGQMLRDAGVSIPTNVDELLDAARKLRNPAKQEFGFYSLSTPATSQETYILTAGIIYGFGGAWFKEGKPTANSAETIAALKFIKQLYDEHLVPRVKETTAEQMFIDGKIAIFEVGPYLAGLAAEQNETTYKNIETATVPFPGKRTVVNPFFIAVPKAAKNKDAAGRFITTLLKPEMQKSFVEIVKTLPAVEGSIPEDFLEKNPWFQAYIEAGKQAVSAAPEGMEDYAPEIFNIIAPAIEEIIFNNEDVEQTAMQLQSELEKFVTAKKAN
ncbi:sugar ABC transporter substrate-binding protein [Mesorhizobium sp. M0643]|uniref:ABC transporter substrate-binding protein n=1 Tax=Mesorhizobium sp. M0643 TaxID=2956978 RepID=UPI0033386820